MTETLVGYDDIPYESFPITETHPDRLAVIGRLFGLETPDPSRARVLELGCAAGGNLIPVAWNLPGTRCLGLELSRAQARRGAALARALELDNVEIRHEDILAFPVEGEPFDYIIAHGVFSWVPEPVQEHVLALCGARLAPGGVAYVSYNALPGGRQRAMLRDMLLYHARGLIAPRERLRAARELLEFLATPLEHPPGGHEWLRREIAYLRGARDSYLYHEYLEERNEPQLFADFAERAGRHGLQYLAESQLHTMFASTLGPAAEQAVARHENLIAEEQYTDFLRLRAFRQTLLCRTADTVTREIDLDDLFSLPLYADLVPDRDDEALFPHADGRTFRVDDPLARTLLRLLSGRFPAAVGLGELVSEALLSTGTRDPVPDRELSRLRHELFNLFVSGGVQFTACTRVPVRAAEPGAGAGPRVSRLARTLAREGEFLLPTPRHQSLEVDHVSGRMIALLDGTRNLQAVTASMEAAAARDVSLERMLGGGKPERLRRQIRCNLENLVALLARHGLLEP